MKCPKCNSELASNSQFCGNCGTRFIQNNLNTNNKKNIKIASSILLVIVVILLAVTGTVIFFRGGNGGIGNILSGKYTINVSYNQDGSINLDDAKTEKYYVSAGSFSGEERKIDVYKINDYISIYEASTWGRVFLEFASYSEEKDSKHQLDSFGGLNDNIGEYSVLTTTEERIKASDYDYDDKLIKEAIKTAPSIHEVALEYSKDEDNLAYTKGTPVVKKINNNISRVDITQSWDEIEYNYFVNFDGNKYYIITVSCNPYNKCDTSSPELKETLNTLEKIEFRINK